MPLLADHRGAAQLMLGVPVDCAVRIFSRRSCPRYRRHDCAVSDLRMSAVASGLLLDFIQQPAHHIALVVSWRVVCIYSYFAIWLKAVGIAALHLSYALSAQLNLMPIGLWRTYESRYA